MGLGSEMKNLSEEILASFKQRIKENEELVNDVQKTLDGFRKDHQEMAAALRAGLDKDEKNRLKEFVPFMKNIKVEVSEIFTYTHDLLAKFVKEIQEMSVEVHDLLAKFDKEHREMSVELRKNLSDGEVERLKEFVALMKSIKEEISEIFTYTDDLLAKFDKEHQAMSVELRKNLSDGEVERLKEFVPLMKNIKEEILRIFTFTHDLLAKFDKEHQDMAAALRAGLDKGEVERLKEFVPFMKRIQNDVKDLRNAVQVELGEASAAWKKMSDILAQLRKTAVTPLKQVVRKAEKKEVKKETPAKAVKEISVEAVKEISVEAVKEIPVEAVEEIPVIVEPKLEPELKVVLTLKEKVLDYINIYPKGVKVSEMEKPLGETRMRLGIVAKNLLDEGKVKKIDNIYFPLS